MRGGSETVTGLVPFNPSTPAYSTYYLLDPCYIPSVPGPAGRQRKIPPPVSESQIIINSQDRLDQRWSVAGVRQRFVIDEGDGGDGSD